ncbi:uncharacterized protein LOC123664058 [Melitaea cinxia]|uniref:uncharacterized protein LOC123664058 n=1 Tax=Melitaea cinxia TaxID=113334 RepID=UPI001E271CC2|nr:uncharacterized protein LOC123664058 [Melitaea cinxia]
MAKKKGFKKNTTKKAAPAKASSITDSINSEVIAAALSSVNQPVFLKVCRLCEAKDGPFLNIFDPDMITAKKIEVVMPFCIAENDDLPHKICFRCSAKVEELYEFIQKCINTQKSLRKTIGAKGPLVNKPRHRELWEEKLNQSNISNDDICDALIKKAMEGIKDIPLNLIPLDEDDIPRKNKASKNNLVIKENTQVNLDESLDKNDTNVSKRAKVETSKLEQLISETLIANPASKVNESEKKHVTSEEIDISNVNKKEKGSNSTLNESCTKNVDDKQTLQTNTFSLEDTKPQPAPAFNIMDHVSMIKVNGVGVLFQCKMCNRNFLKKEVVMSHACAKNGPNKMAGPKNIVPHEPPKITSVKYINTKETKKPEAVNNKQSISQFIDLDDDDEDDKPLVVKKPKPKIGPASKVKRNDNKSSESCASVSNNQPLSDVKTNTSSQQPVVQFPTLPSLNSRYKLVPGPNNTFTLVEEKGTDNLAPSPEKTEIVSNATVPSKDKPSTRQTIGSRRSIKAGKSQNTTVEETPSTSPQSVSTQPYPVGLFKTLPNNTGADVSITPESVTFTTPAMKKQSYTVVQTGNPSKLLISSKPQAVEEVPKKRQRKTRQEVKVDESNKEPFSVTLEDTAPPRDPGFFTFINVDPLLQPSYVLPTNNIIQESQISTSTSVLKQNEKDKDNNYTCNICNESFTREKKLLAHIQSHYTKMDEEDQLRAEKVPRKRRK